MTKGIILLIIMTFPSAFSKAEGITITSNTPPTLLIGQVYEEPYFGPPNWGEEPDTDQKRIAMILKLGKSYSFDLDDGLFGLRVDNQNEVQLVVFEKEHWKFIKDAQCAQILGTFYDRHTGYHRRAVMMEVKDAKPCS